MIELINSREPLVIVSPTKEYWKYPERYTALLKEDDGTITALIKEKDIRKNDVIIRKIAAK